MSLDIKSLACQLTTKYQTNDPFEIADYLGYIISIRPLGRLRGYIILEQGSVFININALLDERQRQLVCAHELGHSQLHKGMNRIFMDSQTLFKTDRLEIDADRFAVDLLFDDNDMLPFMEYQTATIARCLGITEEQAEYRMSSVELKFW